MNFVDFKIESNTIFNNKYDYTKSIFINLKVPIMISCPKHGDFKKIPYHHITRKSGCNLCYKENRKNNKSHRIYFKDILLEFRKIHGYKYEYNELSYINTLTEIEITCKKHGVFKQTPKQHKNGYGCQICGGSKKLSNDEFINNSRNIHGDKYDYSITKYVNTNTKVKIICNKHGEFYKVPKLHLSGSGCQKCNISSGENLILNILEKYKIEYIYQKKFDNCKFIKNLFFDFYIPKYNICLEFDGEQHFKPIDPWGGYKNLDVINKRDNVKNNWCLENNIILFRFSDKKTLEDDMIEKFILKRGMNDGQVKVDYKNSYEITVSKK